jgi:hypothetical protein
MIEWDRWGTKWVRGERETGEKKNRVCHINGSDHPFFVSTALTLSVLRGCWPRRSLLLTYWLLYWGGASKAISRDVFALSSSGLLLLCECYSKE